MPTTYHLNDSTSDLGGGADFNRELITSFGSSSGLAFSVANSSTEDSYGYTQAGIPGATGVTGNYSIVVSFSAASSAIQLSVAVARVNSAGVQQAISSFTAEQTTTTGQMFFNGGVLNSVNLGTWAAGDRLRVVFRFRSTNAHGGAASVTMLFNGAGDTFMSAPWDTALPASFLVHRISMRHLLGR